MESIWFKALENIEKVLTPQTFTTWIEPIRFLEFQNGTLTLEVPNKFFKDWVKERYWSVIEEAIATLYQDSVSLDIKVSNSHAPNPAPSSGVKQAENNPSPPSGKTPQNDFSSNLNIKYTFDTFVCGASNQFAYAAAQAVANKPASNYNPLFVYGGVGLGKTHLVTAIGNHILAAKPKSKISYYSSEKFMNEMINSLRYKKMDEFRNKFRKMDVLIIDDIQFMAGKEATQEEFFHTFNSLYESHKQIILTSDKFPREIPQLEERLRSRFEWGLIADIQPPDTETKVAILGKKAELNGISLPDEVSLFLASSVTSNVRELEGMLVRLGAYASLTGSRISLNLAREVLKDIIIDKNKEITVEMIQKCVAENFNIKVSELKSDKRLKSIVLPRQIAMYLCRDLTKASYPEIGEKFGGKDHSTIIHSVKKMEKQISQNLELKSTIETLRKGLLS